MSLTEQETASAARLDWLLMIHSTRLEAEQELVEQARREAEHG